MSKVFRKNIRKESNKNRKHEKDYFGGKIQSLQTA